ncbi:MAG: putative sulfate exporter family transporter [Actinomycetota bacterium]|uniref:YeiH family protein n=1 Tax=Microbacterium sp. NPDC076768 TaxID=3154858 RepID=UPI00335A07C2
MRSRILAKVPGLALAVGIAIVATAIGHLVPLVGGPVSGIVLGVALATIIKPSARLRPGMNTASKFVLQLSVVVLGSQLSLAQIAKVGLESLPVMLGTLVVCLVAAWLIGRWLGIVGNLRTLIGVGTGICGASAIAAVTPVIGAVGVDVAYAISTIFLFNITAVLVFPIIGHLLGMSQHAFGLFAGTAVNDMSSVVAAATTYGPAATNYAVVVKLVRTLMIIPISLGLAAWAGRRISATEGRGEVAGLDPVTLQDDATAVQARGRRLNVFRLVPWFLIGFIIVAAVNSFGIIPVGIHPSLSAVSVFLITVALSAIGLSTDLAGFRRAGAKPLILGASLWIVVSLTSLGLQFATGLQ